MQKPMTQILIGAGIVPPETVALMEKWGMVFDSDTENLPQFHSPSELIGAIQEVVDEGGTVSLRDTDLDIVKQYLDNQKAGRLHLKDDVTGQKANSAVFYSLSKLGEYVIAWRSESITELMVATESYLKTEEGEKVFFSDVRELYFGDKKAFMVCEAQK